MANPYETDIAAVQAIDAVPTILDVVCRTTGMRFAAVARVTEDRWVACTVLDNIDFGLVPGGELKVETTICNEIRQTHEAVIIDHVDDDEVFCGHPTPAMYGFQSYISMPIIRKDGSFFGTLCAIDPLPHRLKNAGTIGMFRLFAELIALHLDASDRLKASQQALAESEAMGALREQFIAVLGHDLRNPLASIGSGVNVISRTTKEDQTREIAGHMQASVLRMSVLITNVMDFARARLGKGIGFKMDADTPLQSSLEQILEEIRSVHPDRKFNVNFSVTESVVCDQNRVARLFGNLLSNATSHGDTAWPIEIEAVTRDGIFELTVANQGVPIPPETMKTLFHPFYRGKSKGEGLGLGLYIASEIARIHGGTLEASSTPQETRFTFKMPVSGPSASGL